jgi:hypothetical protein
MAESGVLELRSGCTIGQEMAALLGMLYSTSPSNSNSKQEFFQEIKYSYFRVKY